LRKGVSAACEGPPRGALRGLAEVGELVGVRVLDHVIIGRGRFVSFVDDGYW
jgi:DNA repair protein RadC